MYTNCKLTIRIHPPPSPMTLITTRTLLLLATFSALTGMASAVMAEPIADRVVGVLDGDTITVLTALNRQYKIRLSGIDAPESGQAFGQNAKKALSDCAFGKQVSIDGDKLDRYGRTIGRVMVGQVDCNICQVELGLAWHYKKYAGERPVAESKSYAVAEDLARAAKRGLWADPHAIPPWDCRNGGQQAQAAAFESNGQCDCASRQSCTGKRGGNYCVTDVGNKRYLPKN